MKKEHLILLAVCSVALIAFLSQRDILQYPGFTGNDTLTMIDTSRITNFDDFIKVLRSPLMAGSSFVKRHLYYRPVSTLSFSLDYAVWNMDPFGYHLTNLILHILVSLTVFFTFSALSSDAMISWIVAILFASNPLILETVPSPARRQDMLAALFLLLSFLLFIKNAHSDTPKSRFTVLSLGCYLLALGSKENAILLPAVIFTYVFLFLRVNTTSRMPVAAIKSCGPYLILTLFFLGWRILILGSFGKYAGPSPSEIPRAAVMILESYIRGLFQPVVSLFNPPTDTNRYMLIIVLIAFSIVLLAYCRFHGMNKRLARIILALLGLVGIVILARPVLLDLVEHGYQGSGLLARWMEGRTVLPLESYQVAMEKMISTVSINGLILALILAMVLQGLGSEQSQLLTLLLIWLSLAFVLHLITLNFSVRNLYIPLIPFSGCLGVLLAQGLRQIPLAARQEGKLQPDRANVWLFMITVSALIPFCLYSPLFKTYEDWRNCSRLSSVFLQELSEVAATQGKNTELLIYDFPVLSETDPYDVQSEAFLVPHAVQSWLNLRFPNSGFTVEIRGNRKFSKVPTHLTLDLLSSVDHQAVIKANSSSPSMR